MTRRDAWPHGQLLISRYSFITAFPPYCLAFEAPVRHLRSPFPRRLESTSMTMPSLKHLLPGLALTVFGIASAAQAQNHPFGSHHQPYNASTLSVSAGTAAADSATADFYWKWKSRYVVTGCQAGDYRIKASTGDGAYVVSEGQGYGMLITVMMAGQDPQAQAIFDGLHRYNLRHPSQNNPNLLAWAQDVNCRDILDHDSATDGDL